MAKRKQRVPIFYGLHEHLVVLRLLPKTSNAALILRALPFRRVLHELQEDPRINASLAEYRDVLYMPGVAVGQISNYALLLEAYRKSKIKSAEPVYLHQKLLNARGFALCTGLAIDGLKSAGEVEWNTLPVNFRANITERRGSEAGPTILLSCGAARISAFSTSWIGMWELCEKIQDYATQRSESDGTIRGLL